MLRPYLTNAAALAALLDAPSRGEMCRHALEDRADRAAGALTDPEVYSAYETLREACGR